MLCIYDKISIDTDGKIVMNVNDHSLLVDEGFFVSLFQLPSEGISSIFSVFASDMEDILLWFSTSMFDVKRSAAKKYFKQEYHFLADVMAKALIAKDCTFAAMTTAIMNVMKIKWSSFLFNTLKIMVHHSKQSFGFSIQLRKLLEDSDISLNEATSFHRYSECQKHCGFNA